MSETITTARIDAACWAFLKHMAHHFQEGVPAGPEDNPADWEVLRGAMRSALEASEGMLAERDKAKETT